MNIIALSPVYGRPDEYYQDKLRYLHPYLPSFVNIHYRPLPCGFPSIESEYHAASNSAALLEQVEKASKEKNVDGIFIDCFDDPAVTAAREISPLPVCGPYDASIKTASFVSSLSPEKSFSRYILQALRSTSGVISSVPAAIAYCCP